MYPIASCSSELPMRNKWISGDTICIITWQSFQNDPSTLNKRLGTQSIVTNVIESKIFSGQLKLVEKLKLFWEREQCFGTQLALQIAKTSQPSKILFTFTNNNMKLCFEEYSSNFFFSWDKYSSIYYCVFVCVVYGT